MQQDGASNWTQQLQLCTRVQPATCCNPGPSMQIKHPIPALHRAAADGLLPMIQHLGALGEVNYMAPQLSGATALHVAAQCGQSSAIQALVDLGADVDMASDDGSTPLYMACLYCRGNAIQALLAAGADPNRAHNNGATPDLIACPRTKAVLTQWRLFSSSQRRAVRTHG